MSWEVLDDQSALIEKVYDNSEDAAFKMFKKRLKLVLEMMCAFDNKDNKKFKENKLTAEEFLLALRFLAKDIKKPKRITNNCQWKKALRVVYNRFKWIQIMVLMLHHQVGLAMEDAEARKEDAESFQDHRDAYLWEIRYHFLDKIACESPLDDAAACIPSGVFRGFVKDLHQVYEKFILEC